MVNNDFNNCSTYNDVTKEIYNKLDIKLQHSLKEIFDKIFNIYSARVAEEPFIVIKNRADFNDCDEFINRIDGVESAIKASVYSLNTFLDYVKYLKVKVLELKKYAKSGEVIALPMDNKLTYEYENFIIHAQIIIDRLCWAFSYYFGTDKIRYIQELENFLDKNITGDQFINKLNSIIKGHKDILYSENYKVQDDGKSAKDRNIITHRKELMIGTMIIDFQDMDSSRIFFSNGIGETINNFMDADVWLKKRSDDLLTVIEELIRFLFGL